MCHTVTSFNAHTCWFVWSKCTNMSLYVLMYVGTYFYIYLHMRRHTFIARVRSDTERYSHDNKCSDVRHLPLKSCDVRTYLVTTSCLRPIGFISPNSFLFLYVLLLLCSLFHCILSVCLFRKEKFLIKPLYLAVCFPLCMQMRLLVPPCIYICMCVHASFSSTIFSACLCAHVYVRSAMSACLPLYVCAGQIQRSLPASVCMCRSYQLCQPACQCMYVPVRLAMSACLPVYVCTYRSNSAPVCTFVCPRLRT